MTAPRQRRRSSKGLDAAAVDPTTLKGFPPPTDISEKLAEDNMGLAKALASRLARQTRMPFDDLYLVAAMGLLKGCRLFDPTLINPKSGEPYRLSSCVVPYIRGAMLHHLRDRGHSSGVRFPDAWRDVAPAARRLAGQGASATEIGEAIGLPAREVEELLAAQSATSQFDPEACPCSAAPDPMDSVEEHAELAEALEIADQAYAAMSWADQQMMAKAWAMRRGPQLPPYPYGQFALRAERIIRHQPVEAPQVQEVLTIEVPAVGSSSPSAPKRRLTGPREILQAAEQLGLFGACADGDSGKTAVADTSGAGAPPVRPSDQ